MSQQPLPHRPRREYRSTGVWPSVVGGAILLLVILVGILMNLQNVAFHYVGINIAVPLAIVLIVTIVVTAFLTEIIALLWRHQRRRRLTEREELMQLRAHAPETARSVTGSPARTPVENDPAPPPAGVSP